MFFFYRSSTTANLRVSFDTLTKAEVPSRVIDCDIVIINVLVLPKVYVDWWIFHVEIDYYCSYPPFGRKMLDELPDTEW